MSSRAGENEAAGVEAMKFYEVAPNLAMTQHAITIRPDLLLGQDLQGAAARPAAGDPQGRQGSRRLRPPGRESSEDEQKLEALEKAGKLKRIPFKDRAEMEKLVSILSWPPMPRKSAWTDIYTQDRRHQLIRTRSGAAGFAAPFPGPQPGALFRTVSE